MNVVGSQIDGKGSNISDSGISLKAFINWFNSLIIRIDYFWDKCWVMLIKNITDAVMNIAPS